MRTVSLLPLLAGLLGAAPAAAQAPGPPRAAQPTQVTAASSPTIALVNAANRSDGPAAEGGVSPAVLRAEVMLARLHVSPGVIDGREGANFTHALQTFERQRRLKPAGTLNQETWSALLSESGEPVLTTAVLGDDDVKGPFFPDLPKDYGELAKLPVIGYRTPSQKIGARFHMGEALLAALNPGLDLGVAGTRIVVADLSPSRPPRGTLSRVVVDKGRAQVLGLGARDRVIVAYPATIGSRELPSPSGSTRVRAVAWNPVYYYDPQKNFVQGDNKEKLKLPPGPNNPVGAVFIALAKPTYGLHGTPDPSAIDKTASHGCVRMTNWDASELAHLVRRGMVVRFSR